MKSNQTNSDFSEISDEELIEWALNRTRLSKAQKLVFIIILASIFVALGYIVV